MTTIVVKWIGGPEWNPDDESSIDPIKKKTSVEHLIETGGQTIEESIMSIQKFSIYSLGFKQEKPEDKSANWITNIYIKEQDEEMAEFIKNLFIEHYTNKQKQLIDSNSVYRIFFNILEN